MKQDETALLHSQISLQQGKPHVAARTAVLVRAAACMLVAELDVYRTYSLQPLLTRVVTRKLVVTTQGEVVTTPI